MALQVAIKVSADSAGVGPGLAPAEAAFGSLDAKVKASGAATSLWAQEAQRSASAATALRDGQTGIATAMAAATRAAALLGVTLSAGRLIEYADGWKSVESRLKLVTGSAAELRATQEQLFEVAQRTRQSYEATAETFGRFARATQGLGTSSADILRVVETINQAVAVSGGSAASAEAALFQLGQAMASGALRGDELNSVMEQTPRLAEAIAAGMGRSVGELRGLAEQGKLTSDAVLKALLNQGAAIGREFGQITPTVASAFVTLENAVQKYVGEADRSVGATTALAAGIEGLGRNLPSAVKGLEGLAIAAAGLIAAKSFGPWVAGATQAAAASANAAGAAKALAGETVSAAQAAAQAAARRTADAASMQTHVGGLKEQVVRQREAATAQMELTRGMAEATGRSGPYNKALEERNNQTRTLLSYQRLERDLVKDAAAAGAAKAVADAALVQAQGNHAAALARTSIAARAAAAAQTTLNAALAFVGGPVGAAILITAGAIAYLATRTSEAEKAQAAYNTVVREGRARLNELAGASRIRANQIMEEQRQAIGKAEAEVQAIRNKIAALRDEKAALDDLQKSSGLPGITEGASQELERNQQALVEAVRRAQAAEAALDSLRSVTQTTGDAIGAELAAATGRGSRGLSGLTAALADAWKAAGVTMERGKLLTEDQAELAKHTAALTAVIDAGVGAWAKYRMTADQATVVLAAIREKMDPLRAAIADMNREIERLRVPDGAARAALTILQQLNAERAKLPGVAPLTTVSPEYLSQLDKAKELETARVEAATKARETIVGLEKKITAAQAAGNEVAVARLTREKAVEQMVAKGVDRKAAEANAQQDYAVAIAAAGDAAGEAGRGFLRAADAQTRLAEAAGLGEAAARQAAAANKLAEEAAKGNGNAAAQAAANQREEAAAILTIRNETVRGLELETANTNRLTEAMAAGGAAVRVAQEQEYKLALIRKLGRDATVDGTAAQKALNDAMDAYRNNRGANDNSRLTEAKRSANDNLALAQRELDLMGQAEPVRQRALETLRNQQEAARKVAELGEDGAKQWLAWQEQIADTRALVNFQKEVQATSKNIATDLAQKMFDKGGSILDWWRNLLRRMAIEIASTQFIMPIVQQVVGAAPSLFGISAPGGGTTGQAANQNTPYGSLANTATNYGMSKVGGYAMDRLGLSSGWDNLMGTSLWGAQGNAATSAEALFSAGQSGGWAGGAWHTGMGSSAESLFSAGQSGAWVNGAWTPATTTPGVTLGGALGAAGIGAGVGSLLGGWLGTNANSKVVGGLTGAAGGAAAGALAGTFLFPGVGTALGALLGGAGGGLGGLLGTQKATVGPNGESIIQTGKSGFSVSRSLTDNEGDAAKTAQLGKAASDALNTIVKGVGGGFNFNGSAEFGSVRFMQETGKYTSRVAGTDVEFGDAEQAMQDFLRRTIVQFTTSGEIAGMNADVKKTLTTSKATTSEEFANDLSFATSFRAQYDQMRASLDPTNNQLRTFTEQAKELGTQIKTNITDWRAKAAELGLATESDLTDAARKAMTVMMGLGPMVTPLRGLAAVSEQARINLETFAPALSSLGYTAAEQADIAARYTAKAQQDYKDAIGLVQAQGRLAVEQLVNPSARPSVTQGMRSAGYDPRDAGLSGIIASLTELDASAVAGAVTFDAMQTALGRINQALYDGVVSGDQYSQLIATITTAWTQSQAVLAATRSGSIAIESAIDPTWRANLDTRLAEAGLSGGAVEALRPAFQSVLDAAATGTATAGQMRAAQATLDVELRAGTITVEQHRSAVSVLTAAWSDSAAAAQTATERAAGLATGLREGAASIETALDAAWRPAVDAQLAAAGASAAAIAALRPSIEAVTVAAATGAATAGQMRGAQATLDSQLRAGVITADTYAAAVAILTGAWSDSAAAAERATQTATAQAQQVASTWSSLLNTAIQEVSEGYRTTATDARQAATAWSGVAETLARAGRDVMGDRQYSNLLPEGLRDAARTEFTRLQGLITTYADAVTAGNATAEQRQAALDAAGQLDGAGKKYLENQRAFSGDGTAYDQTLTDVRAAWEQSRQLGLTLQRSATTQADTAEAQLDRLERLTGIGSAQRTLLDQIKAAIGTGNTDMAQLVALVRQMPGYQAYTAPAAVTAAWGSMSADAKNSVAHYLGYTGGGADPGFNDFIVANNKGGDYEALVRGFAGAGANPYMASATADAGGRAMSAAEITAAARQVGWTGAVSDRAFNSYLVATGQTGRWEALMSARAPATGTTATPEQQYAAAYPDVATSGMTALAHYILYGAREGRNSFGLNLNRDQAYIARYPDVAEAYLRGDITSGEQHYARWGQAEGRAYQQGGVIGRSPGGVVGNGLYGVDSVEAEYAGGGRIWLAGREGILTAAATDAIGGEGAIAWINRHNALPSANDRMAGAYQRGGVIGGRAAVPDWSDRWTDPAPRSPAVTLDMAPVVTAIGGVRSAVLEIGTLIRDMSSRLANVEDAIDGLAREQAALGVKILKVASR